MATTDDESNTLTSKCSFDLGPTSPPNSAGLSPPDHGVNWADDGPKISGAVVPKVQRASTLGSAGSTASLDSAMGALSIMSSHASLSSLGPGDRKIGVLESKVLIIFVGGTIGMKKENGGKQYNKLYIYTIYNLKYCEWKWIV